MRKPRPERTSTEQLVRAEHLILIGARAHIVERECHLSQHHVRRIWHKLLGKSPARGQSPSNPDWFITWQNNIHASLFAGIYDSLNNALDAEQIDVAIRAYELYLGCVERSGVKTVLEFTRAWLLVKLIDNQVLKRVKCRKCGEHFVANGYDITATYVCGICEPPHRAGYGAIS